MSWQRILRTGLKPRQQELIEWDQRTRLFRAFEATVIPGLFQTAEYARYRFAEGIRRLKLPNDTNEAVAARVQHQEILYRPDKRFHFVLTEEISQHDSLESRAVALGNIEKVVNYANTYTRPAVKIAVKP